MLSWFETKEVAAFGISLAEYFIAKLPLDAKKAKSLKKQQNIIDDMRYKISVFMSKNKMNFYKKARLWNSFKWTLYNAGYDHAFVDELTYNLVLVK